MNPEQAPMSSLPAIAEEVHATPRSLFDCRARSDGGQTFYRAVMKALGAPEAYDEQSAIGFGRRNRRGDDGHTYISIFESAAAAPDERRHWCFKAQSIEQIDRFHRDGLATRGSDDGAPGLRAYHPHYYAAFLRDPEGNRVEAVFHAAPA